MKHHGMSNYFWVYVSWSYSLAHLYKCLYSNFITLLIRVGGEINIIIIIIYYEPAQTTHRSLIFYHI